MAEERPKFQVTDKRFWVVDQDLEKRAEIPKERYPSFVEELKARTEAAERKLKERLASLERENEAFRERLDRRLQEEVRGRVAAVLESLLEVLDNLERALEASRENADVAVLRDGVELCLRLFRSKLAALGVEEMDLTGGAFDPELAEAVGVVPVRDPDADGKVVETLQKGYRMGDRVLRHARVRVGKLEEA
ncbi:MAG: hypothetical protein Kow00109_04850 [Acidobacteriota bacterium]